MIFEWFKKESPEYPEFWKRYANSFSQPLPEFVDETRFVVLDTETTGFDQKRDRMLCIGAVGIENNMIDVGSSFEIYLQQEIFNPESVEIHGILRNEKVKRYSEEEALRMFLNYIGNSVFVAHHAGFDLGMINQALKRLHLPKLKNEVLDTGSLYRRTRLNSNLINQDQHYSLDDIAEAYLIDTRDRHTAAGDAFITAIAFLKIISKLKKGERLRLKELLRK